MIGGLRDRMADLPSYATLAAGSLVWALLMGASAWLSLTRAGWQTTQAVGTVAVVFAIGGLIAFPLAIAAATLTGAQRPEKRFAAAFVALTVFSSGLAAALYANQYRLYYSEWHGEPFSKLWTHQIVFTTLAAIYQFLAVGMRLYFPLGFAALFLASLWFARRRR
ncbi:MAG: hypothetical protein JNL61_22035 [Rhizobiaceae bacterium]|nr:hypothetical protein [Rhizobiaceae bacterium]